MLPHNSKYFDFFPSDLNTKEANLQRTVNGILGSLCKFPIVPKARKTKSNLIYFQQCFSTQWYGSVGKRSNRKFNLKFVSNHIKGPNFM